MSMYQTAPQNQSELTAPLAIELFTRFFTRLLEKEYRYPAFQTELESFKTVLTKQPFNLDDVFIYLAKVQNNLTLEKSPLSANPTYDISPAGGNNFLRALDDYKIKIDPTDDLNLNGKVERKNRPSHTAPPSDVNRRLSVQVYGQDYNEDSIRSAEKTFSANAISANTLSVNTLSTNNLSANPISSPISANYLVPSYNPNQLFETSDVNLTKTKSGDVHEYRTSTDLFTLLLEPSTNKKHDMTFLASKSRLLKENIATRSDSFLNKVQNKKTQAFNLEERTPLRKFVVYAKTQEKQSGTPQKILQTAAEEFAMKYQNDPKTLPYNHFTLINY